MMVRIKETVKARAVSKIKTLSATILTLFLFTGCSQYKSSWSCNNPEGIGCSSISYADRIARKHIILNDNNGIEESEEANKTKHLTPKKKHKKLLINERYSDFKKQDRKEVHLD